jgi:uncharacterized DUF497 family protein
VSLVFDWDPAKAAANLRKHGIGFDEAATVFRDPLGRIFADEWHSEGEEREIIVGRLDNQSVALVVFRESPPNHIRIISARYVTAREQRDHEQFKS